MRKFLAKSGLFLLIGAGLLLSGIAMSTVLRSRTFRPDENYFSQDFVKGFLGGYSAQIILLGNSRVLSGLSSPMMENITGKKVLQLGYSSSNLSMTRMVLESYLRKAVTPPETAILEVSWFTFNPDRTGFHRQFAGDLAMNDPCLLYYSFRYSELFQSWLLRLAGAAVMSSSISYTDYTMVKKEEFAGNDSTIKDYSVDIKNLEKIFPDHVAGVDPELLEDFDAIADLCIRSNIRLVLYTGPEDAGYTALQKDKEEVRRIFLEAARNPGVSYLDYTSDGSLYRKSNENILLNSDHIFFEDIFTRQFTADLKHLNLL
jgi:hypothetical protein